MQLDLAPAYDVGEWIVTVAYVAAVLYLTTAFLLEARRQNREQ